MRAVVVGLGPIGIGAARGVLADPGMELAGLVDIDPAKVGQRGPELEGGPVVSGSLSEMGRADVAIVTTTSKVDRMASPLREGLSLGLQVVSSWGGRGWRRCRRAGGAAV